MDKLRVLIVDDTSLYRMIVTHALQDVEDVEIVGSAPNGKIAQLKPDLITLDVEMPEMDGIETLTRLRDQGSDVGVVMISSLTQEDAKTTMKALELGAGGKLGVQQMKQQGSKILAQDEETSVVFGMPMEAIKTGVVDLVLPLGSIAGQIARLVGR